MKPFASKPSTWLYLHGFASGPSSKKARVFVEWGKERGLSIRALDLRVPSLEHLRFSAIVARVREEIVAAGGDGSVVLIGSSLGGLTACRVAEVEPRVAALFLMAPAFRLAERWRERLGAEAWERWRETDRFAIVDYTTGKRTFVDHGFVEELARIESEGDGYPALRATTCIVHGTKDDVVGIELSRRWAAGKPDVRLVEVDDGHELVASIPRILEEASTFFEGLGI